MGGITKRSFLRGLFAAPAVAAGAVVAAKAAAAEKDNGSVEPKPQACLMEARPWSLPSQTHGCLACVSPGASLHTHCTCHQHQHTISGYSVSAPMMAWCVTHNRPGSHCAQLNG